MKPTAVALVSVNSSGRKNGLPDQPFLVWDTGYTTPCHLWMYATNGQGYGRRWRNGRMVYVHREAWEAARGPIPEGTELDHLCRVTTCVNADHLEAVSHTTNVRRGRTARLTVAQVAEIRASSLTNVALGRQYGVSDSTVSRIRSRVYWREAA